jgi:L-amino acid N-acyltransferase YncA
MIIRKVESKDTEKIAEIYNFYIENSHATFEIEQITVDEMVKRISAITENYPFFVAEQTGKILAYAYASRYKSRSAYSKSVEVSVYVKNNLKQKGIGTQLYEKLFEALSKMDVHAIIAGISLPNDASVKLHERFGMEKVAHFREVGYKFDEWIDVGYWELINNK